MERLTGWDDGDIATFAQLVTRFNQSRGDRPPRPVARQAMKGMSSAGMVTKGRIMSRSSCSRMWQWYM
jgi:hypothetical protein